jgi:hypothetical protein
MRAWERLQRELSGLERWPEYAAKHPGTRRRGPRGTTEGKWWRSVPSHGSHHRRQPLDNDPDPTELPEKRVEPLTISIGDALRKQR